MLEKDATEGVQYPGHALGQGDARLGSGEPSELQRGSELSALGSCVLSPRRVVRSEV